jgi:hypothetical protein
LHDGERAVLLRELDRAESGELLSQAGLSAAQSLEALWRELDRWLSGETPGAEKTKPESPDPNPFTALWQLLVSFFRWLTGKRNVRQAGDDLVPDTHVERMIRALTTHEARRNCALMYRALKDGLHRGRPDEIRIE